jgi:hypothetical protein
MKRVFLGAAIFGGLVLPTAAQVNVPAPLSRSVTREARTVASTAHSSAEVRLLVAAEPLAALRRVPIEQKAVVENFPVGPEINADLELHRFDVFTPDAQILLAGPDGSTTPLPRPDMAFFEGTVAGEPDSRVFLSASQQSVRGYIQRGEGIVAFGPRGGWKFESSEHGLKLLSAEDYQGVGEGWHCYSDDLPRPPKRPRPTAFVDPGTQFAATIAIDTDHELYSLFGSDAIAESNYITNDVAAASAIYWRDVLTRIRISAMIIQTTSDPWGTTTDLNTLLTMFGNYWDANHTSIQRTVAHLFMGRNTGGGIAWVGTLCAPNTYGYGVSGSHNALIPTYPNDPNNNFHHLTVPYAHDIWDLLSLAHEVGHNFGSSHTHCYAPNAVWADWPDHCYDQESGQGCYTGPQGCPAPQPCGTIMSYCHLLSGGYNNIGLFFHPRCVQDDSSLYPNRGGMREEILSVSCLGAGLYGDVPNSSPIAPFIYKMAAWGVTGGCGGGNFCPASNVNRAQMAVFLETALGVYVPPTGGAQIYADVPPGSFGYDFIEDFAGRNITGGCDATHYCPTANVQRSQMSVFLMKAKHGSAYTPPACTTATFTDVPCSNAFAPWIYELVAEGITNGCTVTTFCPSSFVTRGQMSVFIVTTFSLP